MKSSASHLKLKVPFSKKLLCLFHESVFFSFHFAGAMALIELPADFSNGRTVDYSVAEAIQNELYHSYDIEVKSDT